jgi:hypothetical protein
VSYSARRDVAGLADARHVKVVRLLTHHGKRIANVRPTAGETRTRRVVVIGAGRACALHARFPRVEDAEPHPHAREEDSWDRSVQSWKIPWKSNTLTRKGAGDVLDRKHSRQNVSYEPEVIFSSMVFNRKKRIHRSRPFRDRRRDNFYSS